MAIEFPTAMVIRSIRIILVMVNMVVTFSTRHQTKMRIDNMGKCLANRNVLRHVQLVDGTRGLRRGTGVAYRNAPNHDNTLETMEGEAKERS